MLPKKFKFSHRLNIFKYIFYELLSYFVLEKNVYKILGNCKKCGKCCNYMYSYDTYSEKEFKFMQFIFPQYKRFYIRGKDEYGNLIFACKFVQKNGLCSVYKNRLKMCKKYPVKKLHFKPILHEGCGFYVLEKKFKDYLN